MIVRGMSSEVSICGSVEFPRKLTSRFSNLNAAMSVNDQELSFRLGKPPLVEAWIRATFLPSDDAEQWNWDSAVDFLNTFSPELNVIETLPEPPKVERVSSSKIVRGKKRIKSAINIHVEPRFFRIRNSNSTKIVQVGKAEILVSLMKDSAKPYPGFSELLSYFQETLTRFEGFVGARAVHVVDLHYVDLVQIPSAGRSQLELKDYFLGIPELSNDPFGQTWQFNSTVNLIPPSANGLSQLAIQSLPSEDDNARFRLDWHRSSELTTNNKVEIENCLRQAHAYLKQCFRSFCQPKTWQLFAPEEQNRL